MVSKRSIMLLFAVILVLGFVSSLSLADSPPSVLVQVSGTIIKNVYMMPIPVGADPSILLQSNKGLLFLGGNTAPLDKLINHQVLINGYFKSSNFLYVVSYKVIN